MYQLHVLRGRGQRRRRPHLQRHLVVTGHDDRRHQRAGIGLLCRSDALHGRGQQRQRPQEQRDVMVEPVLDRRYERLDSVSCASSTFCVVRQQGRCPHLQRNDVVPPRIDWTRNWSACRVLRRRSVWPSTPRTTPSPTTGPHGRQQAGRGRRHPRSGVVRKLLLLRGGGQRRQCPQPQRELLVERHPIDGNSTLDGISCPSATSCVAVDNDGNG